MKFWESSHLRSRKHWSSSACSACDIFYITKEEGKRQREIKKKKEGTGYQRSCQYHCWSGQHQGSLKVVLTRYAEAIIIIEGGRTRPTRRYAAKGPHTEPYSEALWYMYGWGWPIDGGDDNNNNNKYPSSYLLPLNVWWGPTPPLQYSPSIIMTPVLSRSGQEG